MAEADVVPVEERDTFEPFGLGWRARLCNRTVRVTVRRLRQDHGSLRGYMDVAYRPEGARKISRLAGEQVNLSSGRDRSGFANRLLERAPGLPWRNMIDAFCVEVEEREASGLEFVKIGNLPPPIDGGWLIEGLVERNQTSSVHGDGAVGKSFVGLAACVSLVTGLEVLPGYRPLRRANALYCDYETDRDTMNRRVQLIANGLGIAFPNIDYVRLPDPFVDCVEGVLARVQAEQAELVVVDSVEAAMAGSTSAGAGLNEGPSKLNRALRRLGISALLIDHISSDQGNQKEVARKAYGSIFKRNWVRLAYHLKQAREPGPDKVKHLGLFQAKRNNGEDIEPVGLAWEVNNERARWWREEIDDPDLEAALPTADRIAAYLRREGPSQPSVIAEETGIGSSLVRSSLVRRRDLFVKNDHGLWIARPRIADEDDALP